MSWKCFLTESRLTPDPEDPKIRHREWLIENSWKNLENTPPGAMWYEDGILNLLMPGKFQFQPYNTRSSTSNNLWTVTGEAPNISTTPSIKNAIYHGYIENGIIKDTLDGQKYDSLGNYDH